MTRPADDPHDWSAVSAARLPDVALVSLAAVRHRTEVRVSLTADGFAWVQWPAGPQADDIVAALRAAPGVEFYCRHAGGWRRFGSRLPSALAPPADTGRPLADVLTPSPLAPVAPGAVAISRVMIELVRDDAPRPATALRCPMSHFATWADLTTTRQLAAVRVAVSAGEILALGTLPPVPLAVRYWGDAVRLPLGYTLRPALGPASVRELVGAEAGDLVFLDAGGVEVVPALAFEPATRAGVRLAAGGGG